MHSGLGSKITPSWRLDFSLFLIITHCIFLTREKLDHKLHRRNGWLKSVKHFEVNQYCTKIKY